MRRDGITFGVLSTAIVFVTAVITSVFAQAPTGRVSSLAPAVQKAFEQAYPGATISATSPQRDGNRTLVRVDSVDQGR